jgi:hypothetical protein
MEASSSSVIHRCRHVASALLEESRKLLTTTTSIIDEIVGGTDTAEAAYLAVSTRAGDVRDHVLSTLAAAANPPKYVLLTAVHASVCPLLASGTLVETSSSLTKQLTSAALSLIAKRQLVDDGSCDESEVEEWLTAATSGDGSDVEFPSMNLLSSAALAGLQCGRHRWTATILASYVIAVSQELAALSLAESRLTRLSFARWTRRTTRRRSYHASAAELESYEEPLKEDKGTSPLLQTSTTFEPLPTPVTEPVTPPESFSRGPTPKPALTDHAWPPVRSPTRSVTVPTSERREAAFDDDALSPELLQLLLNRRRHRVFSSCVTKWAMRFVQHRAERRLVDFHRAQWLMRSALSIWRSKLKSQRLRTFGLVRGAFSKWHRQTQVIAFPRHYALRWAGTPAANRRMARCFAKWKHRYQLRSSAALRTAAVVRHVLARWQLRTDMRQSTRSFRLMAIDLRKRLLKKSAMRTWRKRMRLLPATEAETDVTRLFSLQWLFVRWRKRTSAKQESQTITMSAVTSAVAHSRKASIHKAFVRWVEALVRRGDTRAADEAFRAKRARRPFGDGTIETVFARWKGRLDSRRRQDNVATRLWQHAAQRGIFTRWANALADRVALRCLGGTLRRRVLRHWYVRTAMRAKRRAVRQRVTGLNYSFPLLQIH